MDDELPDTDPEVIAGMDRYYWLQRIARCSVSPYELESLQAADGNPSQEVPRT